MFFSCYQVRSFCQTLRQTLRCQGLQQRKGLHKGAKRGAGRAELSPAPRGGAGHLQDREAGWSLGWVPGWEVGTWRGSCVQHRQLRVSCCFVGFTFRSRGARHEARAALWALMSGGRPSDACTGLILGSVVPTGLAGYTQLIPQSWKPA